MPRLFGQGPEGETFEHLAHKVGPPSPSSSRAHSSLFLFPPNLNLVQPPKKVHHVQFVAVFFTAWQVIYCDLCSIQCFVWSFAVNRGDVQYCRILERKADTNAFVRTTTAVTMFTAGVKVGGRRSHIHLL